MSRWSLSHHSRTGSCAVAIRESGVIVDINEVVGTGETPQLASSPYPSESDILERKSTTSKNITFLFFHQKLLESS